MGKNHNTRNAGIVIALVLVVGLYGNSQGWFNNLGTASITNQAAQTGSVVTATTVGGQGLKGGDLVTINVNARDAMTEGSLTEATNTKSTWLISNNGALTVQTTGTAQTVQTSPDGKIWGSFEAQASGQTFIFAVARTVTANGGVMNNDCTFVDIEGDGTKEYLCSFNTTGLTPQQANFGTIPTMNIQTKWFDYTAATISSPADVTSIGTTAGTAGYTTWTLTNTAGDVSTITRIGYKINSTADSKWTQGDMYVKFKNVGLTLGFNDAVKSQDGTNTQYYWFLGPTGTLTGGGYNINQAYILDYPVNGPGTQDIEVKNVWNMASSDKLVTTFTVDQVNEINGAVTQLSDAKQNSA